MIYTQEQAQDIADAVCNKIMPADYVLQTWLKGSPVDFDMIREAKRSLDDLVKWVRKIEHSSI